MGRVRGDPITTALAHPTRRSAYIALAQSAEMSTVQLEKELGVDRYNLYHHLKKLTTLELIENHRDEGRARWWRKNLHVDLPELLHATAPPAAHAAPEGNSAPIGTRTTLASLAVDEEGREVIVLDLEGSRDQVSAKQLIARLSDEFGLSLDIPWNFIPEQLVLYSKKK